MKKIAILLSVMAISSCACLSVYADETVDTEQSVTANGEYEPGDAPLNNAITVRTAGYIARMLALNEKESLNEYPDYYDYNKDGKVDVRDAASIAKYLANQYNNK